MPSILPHHRGAGGENGTAEIALSCRGTARPARVTIGERALYLGSGGSGDRRRRLGRRIRRTEAVHGARLLTGGVTTYRTIVVATDGLEAGDRALATASSFARESRSRIVVVHVNEVIRSRRGVHPVHANEDELQERIRQQVYHLKLDGVDAQLKMHRIAGRNPAQSIADDARAVDADLIVAGSSRHGLLTGLLLGDVTQRLLRIASCPVLAVPRPIG